MHIWAIDNRNRLSPLRTVIVVQRCVVVLAWRTGRRNSNASQYLKLGGLYKIVAQENDPNIWRSAVHVYVTDFFTSYRFWSQIEFSRIFKDSGQLEQLTNSQGFSALGKIGCARARPQHYVMKFWAPLALAPKFSMVLRPIKRRSILRSFPKKN